MRGQHLGRHHKSMVSRIIPARAGPTPLPEEARILTADHPRSCGANALSNSPIVSGGGSSPLVRGQPTPVSTSFFSVRIIPARAGPTWGNQYTVSGYADHPRSCGANRYILRRVTLKYGSSPLVRGQHTLSTTTCTFPRIIPARAGPTPRSRDSHPRRTDHPRSCGANKRFDADPETPNGSSPLVRGQPQ